MRQGLRILSQSFRMALARTLEYKSGLILEYVIDFAWYIVQFSLLRTAYQYVPTIGAYQLHDMYAFLGFVFLNDAISTIFFNGGVENFGQSVRRGTLDFYLLKPYSTLFQVAVARMSVTGFLNVVIAGIFWRVTSGGEVHYPLEHWIWAWALFFNGAFLLVGLKLCFACVSFWTVDGSTLSWLFHEFMRFGSKPEAVYKGVLRRIITSVLPVLLISAWPAMVLTQETTLYQRVYPFGVNAVVFLLLTVLWTRGIRRYEGLS